MPFFCKYFVTKVSQLTLKSLPIDKLSTAADENWIFQVKKNVVYLYVGGPPAAPYPARRAGGIARERLTASPCWSSNQDKATGGTGVPSHARWRQCRSRARTLVPLIIGTTFIIIVSLIDFAFYSCTCFLLILHGFSAWKEPPWGAP